MPGGPYRPLFWFSNPQTQILHKKLISILSDISHLNPWSIVAHYYCRSKINALHQKSNFESVVDVPNITSIMKRRTRCIAVFISCITVVTMVNMLISCSMPKSVSDDIIGSEGIFLNSFLCGSLCAECTEDYKLGPRLLKH